MLVRAAQVIIPMLWHPVLIPTPVSGGYFSSDILVFGKLMLLLNQTMVCKLIFEMRVQYSYKHMAHTVKCSFSFLREFQKNVQEHMSSPRIPCQNFFLNVV